MTESSPILIERPEYGIAIIRLNRPDAMNAPAMMDAYHDALDTRSCGATSTPPASKRRANSKITPQVVAMLTADFDEATKAFVEKRAPRFRGL